MKNYNGLEHLTKEFWDKCPRVFLYQPAREWIEHLAVRGYADRTLDGYSQDLEAFLVHCHEIEIPMYARISVIDAFFKAMTRIGRGRGKVIRMDSGLSLSKRTIVRRAASLKSWFAYLKADQQINANPMELGVDEVHRALSGRPRKTPGRTYMRRPDATPWIPTEMEYQRFADYVRNPMLCSDRDRFMVMLSYECALRASELVSVKIEDFNFEQRTLHVVGKGNYPADIPFGQGILDAWPKIIAERSLIRTGPGPLFASSSNRNYGDSITTSAWSNRLGKIRRVVGLPLLHPHTLRHLSITDLARAGMSLHELQAFARHKSARTTELYIHMSASDVKAAFARNDSKLRDFRASQLKHDNDGDHVQ